MSSKNYNIKEEYKEEVKEKAKYETKDEVKEEILKDSNEQIESKGDNFLLYIPIRKYSQWEVKDGNVYLIFNHEKLIEKFMRWLAKKSNVSDIKFDPLSSMAWQLMDGKNTVYDIYKEMSKQTGDIEKVSSERLIMFLRYMCRKSWIGFNKEQQIK